jgi:hypothetical protein
MSQFCGRIVTPDAAQLGAVHGVNWVQCSTQTMFGPDSFMKSEL